ncbi:hypothetical protein [Gordonia sp. SL306]|uniref:hypothetical protein n=1 Tax=Gordonia sp. SL306 TaxID=2995145 RepID=UPI0022712472|nr:hypothetical protein [Gordonia sp. SL306]WAC53726.1 hypothetical protein OVA31_13480 [Gordonia sp. SL306]
MTRNTKKRTREPRHLAKSFPRGFSYYTAEFISFVTNRLVVLPTGLAFIVGLYFGDALFH